MLLALSSPVEPLAVSTGGDGTVALTDRLLAVRVVGLKRDPQYTPSVDVPPSFTGPSFTPEVILPAIRCYRRNGLSTRDLEEPLAERGIEMDHVTACRWVHR